MIRPKVRVTAKGKAKTKALQAALKKLDGGSVTVGVDDDAGTYPDGTRVSQVALWNEFGTVNTPERSFLRSSFYEAAARIAAWRKEAVQAIALKGWSVEKALSMVGMRTQVVVQNKIRSNVPPPNAPSTVARKQARGVAPRTLIDTTLLLRSVRFRVYLGKGLR